MVWRGGVGVVVVVVVVLSLVAWCCCMSVVEWWVAVRRGVIVWLPLRVSWLLLPFVRACLKFSTH